MGVVNQHGTHILNCDRNFIYVFIKSRVLTGEGYHHDNYKQSIILLIQYTLPIGTNYVMSQTSLPYIFKVIG